MKTLLTFIIAAAFTQTFAAPEPRARADDYYRRGLKELSNNEYRQAESSFLAALKALPEWAPPMLELAETWRLMGEPVERREPMVMAAYEIMPYSPRAVYEAALLARDQQKYGEAISLLKNALELRHEYTAARLELANLELDSQNFASAFDHFSELKKSSFESSALYVGLAASARALGKWADEEEALLKLSAMSGESPVQLQQLRDFYKRSGQEAKAAEIAQKLEQKRPQSSRPVMRPLPQSAS